MSSYVHVEGGRICPQQMIVNSRDIEAAFEQLCHNRIDLGIEQDQIAHHYCFAMHGLEGDPSAERECRSDRHAVECYVEIGTRKSVAMDFATHCGRLAECGIDLLPIDLLRLSGVRQDETKTKKHHQKPTHAYLL